MKTMKARGKRRKMSAAEREAMQQEALSRARTSFSMANYVPIILGFVEKGIPEADISPRENVFTYHAWRALGRQVRKGEHGVKVTTFVPMKRKERDKATGEEKTIESRRPTSATVFHVSQTDPIA